MPNNKGNNNDSEFPLEGKIQDADQTSYENAAYEADAETDIDNREYDNVQTDEKDDKTNPTEEGKVQDAEQTSYESAAYEADVEIDIHNREYDNVQTDEKDINAYPTEVDNYENIAPSKTTNGTDTQPSPDEKADDVNGAEGAEFDDDLQSRLWRNIYSYTDIAQSSYDDNRMMFRLFTLVVLVGGYAAYLIYACIYDFEETYVVLIITGITVFIYIYILIRDTIGDVIDEKVITPALELWDDFWIYIKWPLYLAIAAGLAVGLYFLTRDYPVNLISFGGLIFFVAFCYVFSKYPASVKWRPVIWGLMLQFLLGLFILRTYAGFVLFEWLSDVVFEFLNFASAGSIFLYGDNYMEHYFAFTVLPIIIYFSSVISVLYYWGVMQVVIQKVAWLMQRTMKTSAVESLNAAANIFVGMTEAPLLIKPFLKDMTRSELHAVMTGGFATVAGSTLGAYILSGIDATHLIAASVMSAPAALAISKLFYPETEQSKHVTEDDVKLPKGEELNAIEAAANGASNAIPLVLNIAANLIAFLSLLALLNALLGYFGGLVGFPELTFELICSYVFMPIAFIMGVEWADCQIVAELIGLKTFVNEFYAYDVLSVYIKNRETGEGPTLSDRSEIIATYALCGFANIGSIGIMLGGLTPMAPNKKTDLAAVAIRALIAGTIACFLTACIAGILYVPAEIQFSNSTAIPARTTIY